MVRNKLKNILNWAWEYWSGLLWRLVPVANYFKCTLQ